MSGLSPIVICVDLQWDLNGHVKAFLCHARLTQAYPVLEPYGICMGPPVVPFGAGACHNFTVFFRVVRSLSQFLPMERPVPPPRQHTMVVIPTHLNQGQLHIKIKQKKMSVRLQMMAGKPGKVRNDTFPKTVKAGIYGSITFDGSLYSVLSLHGESMLHFQGISRIRHLQYCM